MITGRIIYFLCMVYSKYPETHSRKAVIPLTWQKALYINLRAISPEDHLHSSFELFISSYLDPKVYKLSVYRSQTDKF